MAWMDQEKKQLIAPQVKQVLKKYRVKGSLAVRNHSTLVLNMKSGSLDFIANFNEVSKTRGPESRLAEGSLDVNPYWYKEHFSGRSLEFMKELFTAMKGDIWYDKSDIMTDYFDTAYYIDVNIGAWNKPYFID